MSSNIVSTFASGVAPIVCLAANARQTPPTGPSPESRQKMAEVHQAMAVCLRSTKPVEACRSEMLKNCQTLMGKDGCPIIGAWGGTMGPGMMGGGMMQNTAQSGSGKVVSR